MEFADLQNLIALAAVMLAVGYLARAGYRVLASPKKSVCGACGSCPASSPDKVNASAGFVTIESLKESVSPRR